MKLELMTWESVKWTITEMGEKLRIGCPWRCELEVDVEEARGFPKTKWLFTLAPVVRNDGRTYVELSYQLLGNETFLDSDEMFHNSSSWIVMKKRNKDLLLDQSCFARSTYTNFTEDTGAQIPIKSWTLAEMREFVPMTFYRKDDLVIEVTIHILYKSQPKEEKEKLPALPDLRWLQLYKGVTKKSSQKELDSNIRKGKGKKCLELELD